ncbi:MAG: hypothetical protein KGJ23_01280 [Euryarchaeota archaeon]|nr:hypothetical protein [Euryarchaeota archaeon]MDE1835230.1 hypothetical protein [Euryarchaeota archaeon]MDE1881033.1 hypothetical protein [Euryarchaeota archaeon]MDE2043526.1 hypothetical protein [Thermoplasmata archaeon]
MRPNSPPQATRWRRVARGERAEVAVFDIVLFVPLLLVALLFLDSVVSLPTSTVAENVNSSRYASEGLATTMQATVWHAKTWGWFCNPFYCYWAPTYVRDWTVSDLILWEVYLVSCGVATNTSMDHYPWMGYYIDLTAHEVASGAMPPTSPTTYWNYYLQFNGTANGAGPGCFSGPTPMREYDGSYPAYPSTTVYTWSTVLQPDQFGEGPVQVQMAFWGP